MEAENHPSAKELFKPVMGYWTDVEQGAVEALTLAVGLAAVLTLGIWGLFGEAWESRLAKKIAKTLEEKRLIESLEQKANAFWESTWTAFESGANAVEQKFNEYLERNEALLNDRDSRQKIERDIAALEDLRDFFGGIPWRWPI